MSGLLRDVTIFKVEAARAPSNFFDLEGTS
jgi:hypothetical protein